MTNGGPVGRQAMFQEILARLDSGQSSLTLLRGVTGSGRTHMLRHLGAAMRDRGWRALDDEWQPVSVDRTIRLVDVRQRLETLASGEASDAPAPREHGRATSLREWLSGLKKSYEESARVLSLVGQVTPLFVGIDGYDPNPTFGVWFTSILIPYLKRVTKPVAIVVADRPEDLRGLERLADSAYTLGKLDVTEVREYLGERGARLQPPLSGAELGGYAEAAAEQPMLVQALGMVFDVCGTAAAAPVPEGVR